MLTITQKRRSIIFLIPVIILLLPLIAMQYTTEVVWTIGDFAVATILLFGTATACETVISKVKTKNLRLAICAVILFTFVVIWLELAVGIFGALLANGNSDAFKDNLHILAPAMG